MKLDIVKVCMYCGIDLKGSDLIFVILNESNEVINTPILKISVNDSDNSDSVKQFSKTLLDVLNDYDLIHIFIKKRAKKGKFAGGPDSFKMEGLVQYLANCPVTLVSSQEIKKHEKNGGIEFPGKLKRYQEIAYSTVITGKHTFLS